MWLENPMYFIVFCFLPPFFSRRKVEIMHTHSLFTLLGERLMLHTNTVTVTTYNTLYEVKIKKNVWWHFKMHLVETFCVIGISSWSISQKASNHFFLKWTPTYVLKFYFKTYPCTFICQSFCVGPRTFLWVWVGWLTLCRVFLTWITPFMYYILSPLPFADSFYLCLLCNYQH